VKPTGSLIAKGTLLCGTLDLCDALVFSYARSHTPPERVLQNIAFGLEGRLAYSQGWGGALLGLLIHYAISFCWVALFVGLVRAVPALMREALAFGIVYGLAMYAVMNFWLLPHTHIGRRPIVFGPSLVNGVLALVVCFGVVLAHLCRGKGRR
jgi:hypothetical protein